MEKNEIVEGLSSPLASEESTRLSLECIRTGKAGLNQHRLSLLNRVPESESWSSFKLNTIEFRDLAYLSAATGDEFALLRGRSEEILFLPQMIELFYCILVRRVAELFQVIPEK